MHRGSCKLNRNCKVLRPAHAGEAESDEVRRGNTYTLIVLKCVCRRGNGARREAGLVCIKW